MRPKIYDATMTARYLLRLSPDSHKSIKEVAQREGVTGAHWCREVIRQRLEAEGKKT